MTICLPCFANLVAYNIMIFLDWQGTDNILKIAMFDEEKNNFSKTKEVPKEIRERIRVG